MKSNSVINKVISFTMAFFLCFSLMAFKTDVNAVESEEVQENSDMVKAVVYEGDTDNVKFTIDIDLINPELNEAGGASRPADAFTLFTREYTEETTKTNVWGVEVVVKNDKVIFVSESYSGDSEIPRNGFVLSVIDSNGDTNRGLLRSIKLEDTIRLEGIEIPEEEEVKDGITNQNGDFIEVSGMDIAEVSDETVIYSADYKFNSTKRLDSIEYTIIDGTVSDINTKGDTFIPLNGYILSVKNTSDAKEFKIGDTVTLIGVSPRLDATMSITNQDGKRVIVDNKNVIRSGPMVVIYTSDYGKTTKTNPWGREIKVALQANGDLKVVDFRDIGEGTDAGIEIPKWGFVLSAYGDPYRTNLQEGELFNVNDTLSLQGISLIELDKQASFEYAAINPTKETNPGGVEDASTGKVFPGLRGADQLIAYTKDWNESTTGTNAYGYEVQVKGTLEEGVVVAKGGNNLTILQDGYILSAHGKGASFLIGNAAIGAKVVVDKETKTVTISTTPESIMSGINENIENAKKVYENAEKGLYDVDLKGAKQALDTAINKFELAKEKLNEANEANEADEDSKYMLLVGFMDLLDKVNNNCDLVYYRTLESKKVEGRAVWHRPIESNLEEVKKNLDEFAQNNFNLIFIETFYNGYSIFPSSTDLIKQSPQFKDNDYGEYGNDLLKAYVEEGKKRGIEVHSWVEDFFVGVEWNEPQSPILEEKPEWALVHYDGGIITPNENKYLFMDPAIPEVRKLLIDLYKEIVTNYDVKGLQLDYIRYPVGHYKSDSGYGEYSVNAFKSLYGIGEDEEIRDVIDRDKNPEMWNLWNEWKQNNITTFVERVNEELKAIDSDLILSTAIFASTTEARDKKMQNWPLWVQNGWIDVTAPMAYYRDTKTVEENVKSMINNVDGMALNYAGIAPSFMGLKARTNAEQTRAAQLGHAQGSAIFASQFVLGLDDVQNVLRESTYRNKAVLPHDDIDKVLEVSFEDLLNKIDNIYIPNGKIDEKNRDLFEQKLDRIMDMPNETSKDLYRIASRINHLEKEINKYALAPATDRLEENLNCLENIINVRAKRVELIEINGKNIEISNTQKIEEINQKLQEALNKIDVLNDLIQKLVQMQEK